MANQQMANGNIFIVGGVPMVHGGSSSIPLKAPV
jgi:hypothetical protein